MINTAKQIFLVIIFFSGQLSDNLLASEETGLPYFSLNSYCSGNNGGIQNDCFYYNLSPDGLWYLTVDKPYLDFLHGGNLLFDDIVDPTYDLYIHKWDDSVVIRYHNEDGLIIDYGNPYWSPKSDRFYMYGYDELYLFIIDEENESIKLVDYPHIGGVDRSSRKTKSIYNFAGPSHDGLYMFDSGPNWLYDGRLVNYMSGKGTYAVYEEDGNISQFSFNIKGDVANDLTKIEIDDYKSDDGIYILHGRKQYQDEAGEWHKQSCVGVVQFTADTADAMISHCLPLDSSAYIFPLLATPNNFYYRVALKNNAGNYFTSVFQYNYETGKKKSVYGPFLSSETKLRSKGFYFLEENETEKVWLYDPRYGVVRLLLETRLWENELPDDIADEYFLSIVHYNDLNEEVINNGRYIFLSNKNYELAALYDVISKEMVTLPGEHIIFMNDYLTWNEEVNGWFFRQKDIDGNYLDELVLIQPDELFAEID
jgi:hypothetical protein